ncbi:MAG: hypothetical protein MK236_01850, partial [Pedosphaera sp.]|nr:hypothetical protein [Pedosphaera sp.]
MKNASRFSAACALALGFYFWCWGFLSSNNNSFYPSTFIFERQEWLTMTVKTNSAPKPPKRILIARGGAIGDFILTLPVFQALKASFPQATLGCLSPAGRGEIAQMAGLADEIRNVDDRCWASFFVRDGQLDGVACNWLSSFDCIISYLHDPNETWKTNVVRVSDAFYLGGCHQPGEISDVPASVTVVKALEPMGIFHADPVPR